MAAPRQLPLRKAKRKEESLDLPKRPTRTRQETKRFPDKEDICGEMSTVILNATTVNTDSCIENENAKTFIHPTVSGTIKQGKSSMRIKQIGTNTNKNMEYCQLAIKKEELVRITRSKTEKKATGESVESQNIPNSTEQMIQNNNTNATFTLNQDNILLNNTVKVKIPKIVKNKAVISIPVPPEKNNTAESKKTLKNTQKTNVNLKKHLLPSPALNKKAYKTFKANEKKLMTPVASKIPVNNNKCIPTQSFLFSKNMFSTKSPSALKVSQAAFQEKPEKNNTKN